MATSEQIAALLAFRDAAKAAGHIWPDYAACEAALESSWGTSQLARRARNVFGQKQRMPPTPPLFGTIQLPTREYVNGGWAEEPASWVVFPSLAESFSERMHVLRSLSVFYPEYNRALAAATGEEYVRAVSPRWSTDPERAQKVLEIFAAHKDALCPAPLSTSAP